jgi:hypothetical protein
MIEKKILFFHCRYLITFLTTTVFFIASCKKDTSEVIIPPYPEEYAFTSFLSTIILSTRSLHNNDTLQLSIKNMPLYSGKGKIVLFVTGSKLKILNGGLQDSSGYRNTLNVEYVKETEFVGNIDFKILERGYRVVLGGHLSIDSVLIGDKYYSIKSDEAKRVYPPNGFRQLYPTNPSPFVIYF